MSTVPRTTTQSYTTPGQQGYVTSTFHFMKPLPPPSQFTTPPKKPPLKLSEEETPTTPPLEDREPLLPPPPTDTLHLELLEEPEDTPLDTLQDKLPEDIPLLVLSADTPSEEDQESDNKESLLKRSQLKAESSIFHSRRNMLSTSKSKRFIKFQLKSKLLNMKRSSETSAFQSREPSPTIMQLKLKSNTSREPLNKPSWSNNQSKKFTKESNTFQFRLKLSTIPKETITSLPRLK